MAYASGDARHAALCCIPVLALRSRYAHALVVDLSVEPPHVDCLRISSTELQPSTCPRRGQTDSTQQFRQPVGVRLAACAAVGVLRLGDPTHEFVAHAAVPVSNPCPAGSIYLAPAAANLGRSVHERSLAASYKLPRVLQYLPLWVTAENNNEKIYNMRHALHRGTGGHRIRHRWCQRLGVWRTQRK